MSKRCTTAYTDPDAFPHGVCLHCGGWRSNHPGAIAAIQADAIKQSEAKR